MAKRQTGKGGKVKRRWKDLTPAQQKGVIAAGIVQNSLLLAALVDLRRRPADRINGSKRLWTAAAFVSWIGPLSYFAYGRRG